MPYCSTRRPVRHSAIIREVCSCSSWELTQRLTIGQCAEGERLDYSVLNKNVFIKSLPSGAREACGRGGRNKSKKRWRKSRQVSFRHIRTDVLYELTDCVSMCRTYTESSQTGSQPWKEDMNTGSHWTRAPNRETISNWHFQRKNLFSPMKSHWGY